jgi:ribosome maturation factor RimP
MLETEDPISGEYALEVSSPGIDRPLTRPGDFAKWIGHEVKVEIGMPVDGRRRFHGYIASEAAGVVTLDLKDGGQAEIPFADLTKANLVLTDKLIAQAQAGGLIADEEMDEDFDEVEVEDDEEFDDEAVAAESEDNEDDKE